MRRRDCYIARTLPDRDDCEGELELHHWFPQRRFRVLLAKQGFTPQEIGRELWTNPGKITSHICQRHHHLVGTAKSLRLTYNQHPEAFREWAEEHGVYYDRERCEWFAANQPKDAA